MSKEVTLKEFAEKYNTVLTRRGKRMSEGYLYRVIREDIKGERENKNAETPPRPLWFKYKFEGDKDIVRVLV